MQTLSSLCIEDLEPSVGFHTVLSNIQAREFFDLADSDTQTHAKEIEDGECRCEGGCSLRSHADQLGQNRFTFREQTDGQCAPNSAYKMYRQGAHWIVDA